jgi:iduronate 2-sulfatase
MKLKHLALLVCLRSVCIEADRLEAHEYCGDDSSRPNVLFVAIDDLFTEISTFGNPTVKMPNLDRLATRSVVFDRAYCQYPMCNPCRSSVITGRRPESTGVLTNAQFWRDHVPDAVALPQHFSAHGYETVAIGKILHGRRNQLDAGWDRAFGYDSTQGDAAPSSDFRPRRAGRPLTGPYPIAQAKGITLSSVLEPFVWGPSGLDGLDELDNHYAHQAIAVLKEERERPLFLAVGFYRPHLKWTAPDRFFDMYPPENIKLPENPANDLDDLPRAAKVGWLDDTKIMPPEMIREATAAYYACCTFADSCIGQVLDALEETGQAGNTIIVLWSDHGFMLRHHFMWGKSRLFEIACRTPLLISVPGMETGGRHCGRLVELVDIYPTLVELCRLPEPEWLEGISMVPLLQDPTRTWKKAAFSVVSRRGTLGRSVRTERCRYNQYGSMEQEELYDHATDPDEFTNLARDPAYAQVVTEMREILAHGWQNARPQ